MKTETNSVLNDPAKWGGDTTPPHFNAERFQRRMDGIVGLNRDGKSILRLVWGPTVETWAMGERVPRYWTKRVKEGDGWLYYRVPRWFIEKRLEKECYWDAHNANRFQKIDATGDVIDLGPPPEDYYVFDSLIAKHEGMRGDSGEPLCCERAWEGEERMTLNYRLELVSTRVGGRRRCWGEYREPDESDMRRVRAAVRRMKAEKYSDPYAPLSPGQLAIVEMEANLQTMRMAAEEQARIAEINRDFNRTHLWRLDNTDAGKRSRFHFMN